MFTERLTHTRVLNVYLEYKRYNIKKFPIVANFELLDFLLSATKASPFLNYSGNEDSDWLSEERFGVKGNY